MAQAGTDEHQRGIAVGEGSDYSGSPSDLAVQAFNDVVRADPGPMLGGEIAVGQRFFNAVFHPLRRLFQFYLAEFSDDCFSFFSRCLFAFLCMNRLEHLRHQLHLRTRHDGKHIAVEMYYAALVFRIRKYLAD